MHSVAATVFLQESQKWKGQFGADRFFVHQVNMYDNRSTSEIVRTPPAPAP